MTHLDEATPAELRAIQERRELLRRAAASVVADHTAGRVVDPHTLTWARQVVQNNAPLQGWLGDGRPGANTTESR